MDRETTHQDAPRRRVICRNSCFKVCMERVDLPGEEPVDDYLVVVPHYQPDSLVTGAAVLGIVENKIALLEVYRPAVRRSLWEIPRGFVLPDENPAKAALRELKEETPLRCRLEDMSSLGYIMPAPGVISARIHLFAAKNCTLAGEFIPREAGHKRLEFFEPGEIAEMASSSVIEDPCTLVAWLRYRAG